MKNSSVSDLDRADRALLRAMLDNARQSQQELADHVGLSASACARRLARLEEVGIIRGYHAEVDERALGFSAVVIVQIALERQSEELLAAFEKAVARCPSVLSCYLMSGADDYLLKVAVRDIADFERIHKEELSRLPGVTRLHSSFALREIVRRTLPEF